MTVEPNLSPTLLVSDTSCEVNVFSMQKPSTGFAFDLPSIDTTPIVPDTGAFPGLPDTQPSAAAGVY